MADLGRRLRATPDGVPIDAHTLLVRIYADPETPLWMAMDCAKHALRVEKPYLQASAVSGVIEHRLSVAEQLAEAIRTDRLLCSMPQVPLAIEAVE